MLKLQKSPPRKEKIVMTNDLPIKNGIIIPEHELEMSTSKAGGPGGQHVNKTNTRVTLRWNVNQTSALTEQQKERVLTQLQSQLTTDGDLIIHSGGSRSLEQNKKTALALLSEKLRKALHVPKKRMKTRVPKGVKEARLKKKKIRSDVKKIRSKKIEYN